MQGRAGRPHAIQILCQQVVTDAKEFAAVRGKLSEAGLPVSEEHSGLVYMPLADIEVCMFFLHAVSASVCQRKT